MKKLVLLFLLTTSMAFAQQEDSFETTNDNNISKCNTEDPQPVYVTKPTYSTFFGFVTMRYTVFYCEGSRSREGGTWWCGCSEWVQ